MLENRDPILAPVPIMSLRPTQITVGYREVEEKRSEWRKLGKKAGRYLGGHMIPVVIGPKGRAYVTDHHHLSRALLDEGQRDVLVQPLMNLEDLSEDYFWRFLDRLGLVHPFDESGERRGYDAIPKKIAKLRDDPFRSLAGAVRRAGGYAKDVKPFVEFVWADFFRQHFTARDVQRRWDQTLDEALDRAHHRDARFLPGWCGRD
jgi:hypothetical protein